MWSRCGTSERTTQHTVKIPFLCRRTCTRGHACAVGWVSFSLVAIPDIIFTETCKQPQEADWCFACVAGYSGLVLDSARSNVFCNCTDDNIYMFNLSGTKTTPGKRGPRSDCACCLSVPKWPSREFITNTLPSLITRWSCKLMCSALTVTFESWQRTCSDAEILIACYFPECGPLVWLLISSESAGWDSCTAD